MKPDLSKKIILVTGGGRGLGRHAARHLAACGAVLGVADMDPHSCRETVKFITDEGGRAHAYTTDVSDRDQLMDAAATFAREEGHIDAVINNAMMLRYEPIEEVKNDILDRMLGAGIKGSVWGAQALLKHMDPQRGGCIINMASPVIYRGYPNTSIYSTVKGAVATLTRVLAAELGPRGVRVNAVSPGSVPTPGARGMVSEEEYARRAASIPLRRVGNEQDNSNAIAFLLSEEAAFINGEILNVDGGIAACGA
jgi:meso-butanediol dehydrogenase/(S,S)-butanediol dehydrogenase/diacetyl reductase